MPRNYGRKVGFGVALSPAQPLPLFTRLFDWAIEVHNGFHIGDKPSACWIWQGHCDLDGYPEIKWRGKKMYAHRLSYAIFNGGVEAGNDVDHKCNCRACINPNHLQEIEPYENRVVLRDSRQEIPI